MKGPPPYLPDHLMHGKPGALPLMHLPMKNLFDLRQAKGGLIVLTLNVITWDVAEHPKLWSAWHISLRRAQQLETGAGVLYLHRFDRVRHKKYRHTVTLDKLTLPVCDHQVKVHVRQAGRRPPDDCNR